MIDVFECRVKEPRATVGTSFVRAPPARFQPSSPPSSQAARPSNPKYRSASMIRVVVLTLPLVKYTTTRELSEIPACSRMLSAAATGAMIVDSSGVEGQSQLNHMKLAPGTCSRRE